VTVHKRFSSAISPPTGIHRRAPIASEAPRGLLMAAAMLAKFDLISGAFEYWL